MIATPVSQPADDPETWDDHRCILEYRKFAIDAAYFIHTCLVIDDAQGHGDGSGTMRFELWPAQAPLAWELMTERLAIILKARQLGISWLCCAFELWRCLFMPGQAVLLFSIGEDEAKELLRRVRLMYERMPTWLQAQCPLARDPNTSEMEWANGSRVRSLPSSRVKGSSFTASSVLLDEFAKVGFADDLLASVKPTIDSGGQLIIVSTAFGIGGKFHALWTKASAHQNAFRPIFLPWWARPGRDQAWYARQLAEETDPDRVKENYPANANEAFRVSGRVRFRPQWIAAQSANIWPEGLPAQALSNANLDSVNLSLRDLPSLVVYQLPEKGRTYVVGADVAEGLEHGDFSTAVVIDEQSWVEMATIHGHWEPDEFAQYLAVLSWTYNDARIAPERNNHGHAVIAILGTLPSARIFIGQSGRYGWLTNAQTKPAAVDILAEALRDGLVTVRTQATLNELQSYRTEPNGNTSAPEGYFDDRVMAWAIALSVAREPRPDYTLGELTGIPMPRRNLLGSQPTGADEEWNRRTDTAEVTRQRMAERQQELAQTPSRPAWPTPLRQRRVGESDDEALPPQRYGPRGRQTRKFYSR
jgi:hypothetical protein